MDTAYVVLLAAAIAAIASTASPLLLSRMTARQLRESKAEDYARQDQVAAKAAEAAEKADAVAAQAREAARLLEARQNATAANAAEAARLLLAANAEVAAVAKATAANVDEKLNVIHGLVNSTLTGAMADQLLATEQLAVALREIIDLRKAAGLPPTPGSLEAVAGTDEQVAELKLKLADRARQTAIADAQVLGGKP